MGERVAKYEGHTRRGYKFPSRKGRITTIFRIRILFFPCTNARSSHVKILFLIVNVELSFNHARNNSYGWKPASKCLLRFNDRGTGMKFTVDKKDKVKVLFTSFWCLLVSQLFLMFLLLTLSR